MMLTPRLTMRLANIVRGAAVSNDVVVIVFRILGELSIGTIEDTLVEHYEQFLSSRSGIQAFSVKGIHKGIEANGFFVFDRMFYPQDFESAGFQARLDFVYGSMEYAALHGEVQTGLVSHRKTSIVLGFHQSEGSFPCQFDIDIIINADRVLKRFHDVGVHRI